MPSTIICSKSACCLRPPSGSSHPRGPSIPRLEAAQHRLKRSSQPSSCLPCLLCSGARHACRRTDPSPPSQLRRRCGGGGAASRLLILCLSAYGARQAAPLHACHLRIYCIKAAAVAPPQRRSAYSTQYAIGLHRCSIQSDSDPGRPDNKTLRRLSRMVFGELFNAPLMSFPKQRARPRAAHQDQFNFQKNRMVSCLEWTILILIFVNLKREI